MTANKIKALILEAGFSQKELAKEFDCLESQLSQTIHGHQINQWIRIELAKKLGRKVQTLFGEHPQPASEHKRAA